jgi:hypothetical protein
LALVLALYAQSAQATLVNWNIDSAASYVRLNIGDQNITYSGIGINARLRNQNSNSSWTDAGGRRANVQGVIQTQVNDAPGIDLGSIKFLGLSGTAIEDKNLRPNPAVFDPNVTSTTNPDGTFTSTVAAPAAYGGRINALALVIVNLTAGFFSVTDVTYDTQSGWITLGGGGGTQTIAGGTTTYGFSDAVFAIDGIKTNVLGQELNVPDIMTTLSVGSTNTAASTVTHLGGRDYKLTYNVLVPIQIELEGVGTITGNATGVVVGYATIVPEPSTLAMLGLGVVGLAWQVIRRRRNA